MYIVILPSVHAQSPQIVQGNVKDEKGEAIIGATVCEKGNTSNSTMTDEKGHFTLRLKGSSNQAFVSFVGYERFTFNATAAPVTVKLKQTNSDISEVVVVGYQQVQRHQMTAAVSTIKGSDIANVPEASFTQMLQGRLSGVSVQSATGQPGAKPNIVIRGSTNVDYGNANGGNTGPLYIIDGIIFDANTMGTAYAATDPVSLINPNDIESIDVLKDASASAIYGARAGNGVIIVKTKRAKQGKPQVSVSGYYGVTQRPTFRKVYTGAAERALKLDLLNSQLDYKSIQDGTIPIQLTDSLNTAFNNDVDWQNMLIRQQATVNNEDVSVSGYSGNSNYYLSLNHYNEQGLLNGYQVEKMTPHMSLTINPVKRMSITANVILSMQKLHHGAGGNFFFNSWTFPTSLVYLNPEQLAIFKGQTNTLDDDKITTLNASISLVDTLAKNLTFTSQFNGNNLTDRWDAFTPATVNGFLNTASSINTINPGWAWENYLNYRKEWHKHLLTAIVGTSALDSKNYYSYASGSGMSASGINTIIGVPTGPFLTANSSRIEKTTVSMYGSVGYIYNGRYLLNAALRRDASSIYSSQYRWGTFPSVGAGWIVSDEGFFQKAANVVNFLKLRASWGIVGNDPGNWYSKYQGLIPDASYFGSTTASPYNNGTAGGGLGGLVVTYNGASAISPFNYNNDYKSYGVNSSSTVRWEKVKTLNLGVDLEFLNNRVSSSFDIFQKDAIDKYFYGVPAQATAGYTAYSGNYVNVRNQGIEVTVNSRNLPAKSPFQWSTNFNISFIRNLVTKLPNGNRDFVFGDVWFQRKLTLGKPLFDYAVWKTNGVYATQADVPVDPLTGKAMTYFDVPLQAGDSKIADQNGDYNIDYNDKVSGGNPNPKFFGGLRNTFSYKGFSLDVFFSYSYGNTISNGALSDALNGSTGYAGTWGTVAGPAALGSVIDEFWTKPGDQTKFPRMVYPSGTGSQMDPWNIGRSYFLEDGSFIKLKTATLGYNLPATWIRKLNMKMINVYIMGENLWMYKKSSVPDPELYDPTTGSVNTVYPTSTKFTAGVRVNL